MLFKPTEWNDRPPSHKKMPDGSWFVTRNVEPFERDGVTFYRGESAYMSATEFAAYVGAKEAESRRESDIIDDYTLALIEEGVL